MLRTAVVTGNHHFDIINFHRLFRELDGIDAYIQHLEDFATSPQAVRDSYEVVIFYNFQKDNLAAENLSKELQEVQDVLAHLGSTPQGLIFLHHGLLAYPDWAVWDEIIGVSNRTLQSYADDQQMNFHIIDPAHPIMAGLSDWTMIDETYEMPDAAGNNQILLTTDHPRCMKTLAWVRQYGQSRVFCLESGHDNQAWSDPNFRQLLTQGMMWCGRRC